jgi:hypothetical protein
LAQTTRRLEANDRFLQEVIASSRNEQRVAQQKLEAFSAEKSELLSQLGRLNNEHITLRHQVGDYVFHPEGRRRMVHYQIHVSYSQAASLAAEADRQRMAVISELFVPANSFFDASFTPVSIKFNSAKDIVDALPRASLPLYISTD